MPASCKDNCSFLAGQFAAPKRKMHLLEKEPSQVDEQQSLISQTSQVKGLKISKCHEDIVTLVCNCVERIFFYRPLPKSKEASMSMFRETLPKPLNSKHSKIKTCGKHKTVPELVTSCLIPVPSFDLGQKWPSRCNLCNTNDVEEWQSLIP